MMIRSRKSVIGQIALLLVSTLLIFSCAGGAAPRQSAVSSDGQQGAGGTASAASDVYNGIGRNASLGKAMSAAKMNAVKNAVIDMIGAANEQANQEKLSEVLYNSSNPNAYVYPETMETLRKENVGTIDKTDFVYEISIRVNKAAVENTLKAAGIIGQSGAIAEAAAEEESSPVTEESSDVSQLEEQEGDWSEATEEEARFIRRYVENMTYMVYFNEESGEDPPFLMKSAVSMANSYLAENGMSAVDMSQVESLKEDQQLVYEEETGQAVSIIQWIAQRLNADVYIEIDAVTSAETRSGNHYGTANITLKMFETSTGELLGSLPYRSQRTFSRVSEQDAVLNAIQSTIYKAMPIAVQQSRELLAQSISRGIRYQLIIQNTYDSRVMSKFRRELRDEVEDLETVSQTAEETVYNVYFFGRIDELEDQIYEVSERVPGMENIFQVLTRGKSITFDSGM